MSYFGAIKLAQMYRENTKYAHKNGNELDERFVIACVVTGIIVVLLVLCFYCCYFQQKYSAGWYLLATAALLIVAFLVTEHYLAEKDNQNI